jgi:hypothetical protein
MVRRNAALVIMGSESAPASAGLLAAIDPNGAAPPYHVDSV